MTLSYWGLALPLGYLLAMHWGGGSPDGTVDFWVATILGIAVAAALIDRAKVRRIGEKDATICLDWLDRRPRLEGSGEG